MFQSVVLHSKTAVPGHAPTAYVHQAFADHSIVVWRSKCLHQLDRYYIISEEEMHCTVGVNYT